MLYNCDILAHCYQEHLRTALTARIVIVEFEAAFNLLVAIALNDANKTGLEQILKTIISEPAQKTTLKFKVYVNMAHRPFFRMRDTHEERLTQ